MIVAVQCVLLQLLLLLSLPVVMICDRVSDSPSKMPIRVALPFCFDLYESFRVAPICHAVRIPSDNTSTGISCRYAFERVGSDRVWF